MRFAPLTLLLALLPIVAHAQFAGTGTVRVPVESRGPQAPMLLGNERHTGVAHFDGPTRGAVVWKGRVLGGLIGSPAADADGNLYFATQSGWLHVFKPDGTGERRIQLAAGTHSTPAITRSGLIIIPTRDGKITAYTKDLTPVWVTSVGKELLSSPVIDRRSGMVVVSARDVTVGVDIATGAVRFRWSAGNDRNNSTPTIAPDGNIRITNWGGFAVSLDPAGTEVWRATLGREGFWSSPTLGTRGELYTAGTRDRQVVAISPAGRPMWRARIGSGVSSFMAQTPAGALIVPNQANVLTLDPGTGAVIASTPIAAARGSTTPAVSRDGIVYFGTSNSHLHAYRGSKALWTLRLPGPLQGAPILVAPVSGRGRIVAADISGNIVVVE